MTSRLKGIAAAVAIVGAVVLTQLSAALPASASVSCYGDYCSGRDPQSTGCSADAYSFASARIPGTSSFIELRWSPTCKSEWARVPASWGKSYPNNPRVVQRSTGYSQVGVVASNSSYSWTRMIYSPRLCVYAAWIGPPGSVATSCV